MQAGNPTQLRSFRPADKWVLCAISWGKACSLLASLDFPSYLALRHRQPIWQAILAFCRAVTLRHADSDTRCQTGQAPPSGVLQRSMQSQGNTAYRPELSLPYPFQLRYLPYLPYVASYFGCLSKAVISVLPRLHGRDILRISRCTEGRVQQPGERLGIVWSDCSLIFRSLATVDYTPRVHVRAYDR